MQVCKRQKQVRAAERQCQCSSFQSQTNPGCKREGAWLSKSSGAACAQCRAAWTEGRCIPVLVGGPRDHIPILNVAFLQSNSSRPDRTNTLAMHHGLQHHRTHGTTFQTGSAFLSTLCTPALASVLPVPAGPCTAWSLGPKHEAGGCASPSPEASVYAHAQVP